MKALNISQLPPHEIEAAFAKKEQQIAELKNQLSWFKRQIFGRKSEKQIHVDPKQGALFEEEAAPVVEPDEGITIPSHKRRNKTD